MTSDQAFVFAVLAVAFLLFVYGRWRYDFVAVLALLAVTVADIVPESEAFAGFGHPAVITVAAVLIVGRGFLNSGVVDVIADWLSRVGDRPARQVPALTGVVTSVSGFMNDVGALAILLPVGVRMGRKSGVPPSLLLMPLAFGSLLGGLVLLIGTPPNIIIATFRGENGAEPFRMFDFTPVGAGVALAGALFISFLGWRLLPARRGQASQDEMFRIQDYVTEVRLPEDSKLAGAPLRELEATIEADVTVLAVLRGERRLPVPSGFEELREDDVLVVRADPEALKEFVDAAGLELVGEAEIDEELLGSDEVGLMEAVVIPGGLMEGRSARGLSLRRRYGINLLAVSRQGSEVASRLDHILFRAGDVVLLQGGRDTLQEAQAQLGCLPLAERQLRLGQPRRVFLAVATFGGAIAVAALGWLPVQVAFTAAAAAMVLLGLLSLRDAYDSIDWPIIVLLGAMIPVGQALETTGGADVIANRLVDVFGGSTWVALCLVLVVAMLLSNVVNNAAAAVLMAPIAVNTARGLDASVDPFLMAVAIGASTAFLTPIGHQSNTLVLGPGGYKFGDYWRMGLPLSLTVVVVAVPLILLVWPP